MFLTVKALIPFYFTSQLSTFLTPWGNRTLRTGTMIYWPRYPTPQIYNIMRNLISLFKYVLSDKYIHSTMLGIGTKLLFCEYRNSIFLKIFHTLMTYRCGKHEKQDRHWKWEKQSRKHRLNAKHTPDKNLYFIKPHLLPQLVKIILSN